MGFRSNFITEDFKVLEVPQWFVEKYHECGVRCWKNEETGKYFFPIALMTEWKFYLPVAETEIFQDIQRILKWNQETNLRDIVVILLHECGGITRVKITYDSITAREPTEWKDVENVEHSYCDDCSDKVAPTGE